MTAQIDDPLFLGLDLSTQGLKAVLIDSDGTLVHESAVNFDRDLSSYGTTNGAIRGPDPGQVTSPVRMWLDAYDLIMERMREAGVDFLRILGISGDGQVRLLTTVVYACLEPADNVSQSNMDPCTGRKRRNASSHRLTLPELWPTSLPPTHFRFPALLSGKTLLQRANVESWRRPLVVHRLSLILLEAEHMKDLPATRLRG